MKMGNLLSIAGDNSEEIKQFIDSFLSQDSESNDTADKCVDFCKIIPVDDPTNESECFEKWGVKQNAENTFWSLPCIGVPTVSGRWRMSMGVS